MRISQCAHRVADHTGIIDEERPTKNHRRRNRIHHGSLARRKAHPLLHAWLHHAAMASSRRSSPSGTCTRLFMTDYRYDLSVVSSGAALRPSYRWTQLPSLSKRNMPAKFCRQWDGRTHSAPRIRCCDLGHTKHAGCARALDSIPLASPTEHPPGKRPWQIARLDQLTNHSLAPKRIGSGGWVRLGGYMERPPPARATVHLGHEMRAWLVDRYALPGAKCRYLLRWQLLASKFIGRVQQQLDG